MCLWVFAGACLAGEDERLAVLCPDVPEPYSIIFDDIVAGIDAEWQGELKQLVLPREIEAGDVQAWLQENELTNVIALGNQAMGVVLDLPENYVTVTGAVLSVDPVDDLDEDFSAIVLAPDPDKTFEQLKALADDVETVSVIYSEDYHHRLIARAREVATKYGIKLEIHKAVDISSDSQLYRKFFKVDDARKHAVWLLQGDRALEDRSVLYNLLKDAWYSKMLVFSDNPSYVKKGVLFSLYPDNAGMGKSLVEALEKQQQGEISGVAQTTTLHSALNIRTAEHLGLSVSRSQRKDFDVIFPRR